MAQFNLTADERAGYRALKAAQTVLTASHPAGTRLADGVDNTAQFTDYTIPAPVLFVLLKTDETGELGVLEYVDLAALQTAVAAME